MENNRVKTQQEYDEVEKILVPIAMKTLGISERAAKLRIKAIVKSGIMERFGKPDELTFQVAIDAAMCIPQMGEKE